MKTRPSAFGSHAALAALWFLLITTSTTGLLRAQTTTYYEVWRNTVSDLSTATILRDGLPNTSCLDAGVPAGQTYYYWVRAVTTRTVRNDSKPVKLPAFPDLSDPEYDTGWLELTIPLKAPNHPVTASPGLPIRYQASMTMSTGINPIPGYYYSVTHTLSNGVTPFSESATWTAYTAAGNYQTHSYSMVRRIESMSSEVAARAKWWHDWGLANRGFELTVGPETIVLVDSLDTAPSVTATLAADGVHLTWNACGGLTTEFSAPAAVNPPPPPPGSAVTYYEVWRGETSSRAEAVRVAAWLPHPGSAGWLDKDTLVDKPYWYWVRAVTAVTQSEDDFREGSGSLELRCPVKTKSALDWQTPFSMAFTWKIDGDVSYQYDLRLEEVDLVVDDVIRRFPAEDASHYTVDFGNTPECAWSTNLLVAGAGQFEAFGRREMDAQVYYKGNDGAFVNNWFFSLAAITPAMGMQVVAALDPAPGWLEPPIGRPEGILLAWEARQGMTTEFSAIASGRRLPLPVIAQQPQSQTVPVGSSAAFTVYATNYNADPLAYRWYHDAQPLQNDWRIAGATSAALSIASASAGDAGNYWVVVSNVAGAVTSAVVSLTVTNATTLPPPARTISVNFVGGTLADGSDGGWVSNTPPLAGAPGFEVGGWQNVVGKLQNGLVLRDDAGNATSARIGYSVGGTWRMISYPANDNERMQRGYLDTHSSNPLSVTLLNIPFAHFTLVPYFAADAANRLGRIAVGSDSRWFRSMTVSGGGTTFPPFTAATGTNSATALPGDFAVFENRTNANVAIALQHFDSGGYLGLQGFQIRELLPPRILVQPVGQTVAPGANVTLNVVATNGNPLGYQWFKDGVALTGMAGAGLSLANVSTNDTGGYTVIVSNGIGSVTSAVAVLRVSPDPVPDLNGGLMAYYPFEFNANDVSGNGAHGQIHGSPTFVPGVAGSAVHLVGAGTFSPGGDYVGIPTHDFSSLDALTVALWVKEEGMSQGSGESYISFGDHYGGSITLAHWDELNYMSASTDSQNTAITIPFDNAGLNRWVHYCLTYANGIQSAYRNGALVGTLTAPIHVFGTKAGIGTHWWSWEGYQSTRLIGAIDEVRIYNRALSEEEIQLLYGGKTGAAGRDWVQATPSAPWGASQGAGLAATEFKGKLWVTGGGDGGSTSSQSVWCSADGTNWALATDAPGWAARVAHRCLVYNEKLWLMGGGAQWSGSSAAFNDVWWSDNGTNWFPAVQNAPWPPRTAFGAAVFKGKIHVIGGYGPGNLQDVWTSSDGTNWQQVLPAPAWTGRHWVSSVVHNGRLWIMGGQTGSMLNEIWSTGDGTNWVQAPAANHWSPRAALGAASFNGRIWVFGGTVDGGPGGETNDVWSSLDGTTWERVASAAPWPARYVPSGGATFQNRLWIVGGWRFGVGNSPDVWWSGTTGQAGGSQLTMSPTSLTNVTTALLNAPGQTLTIQKTGTHALAYSFSVDVPWLTVATASGSSTGEVDTVAVQFQTAGLAAGQYSGHITVTSPQAGNSPQVVTVTLMVLPPLPLGEATGATNLVWTSGGPTGWLGQSNVSHDGLGAAASGALGDSQTNWMETTVTGPGTLSFWWKVSSEQGWDHLKLNIGGTMVHGISGERDWSQETHHLSPGPHTIRWAYSKDGSMAAGQDRCWVDEVSFQPDAGLSIVAAPRAQTNYVGGSAFFSVNAQGGMPIAYQWRYQVGGTTYLLLGDTNATMVITNLIAANAGYYFVTVSNAAGTTNVGASLTVLPVPPFEVKPFAAGSTMPNGGFPLRFTSPPGVDEVVIEATTNLVNWTPIYTNRTPTPEFDFMDRGASNQPSRYFRSLAR